MRCSGLWSTGMKGEGSVYMKPERRARTAPWERAPLAVRRLQHILLIFTPSLSQAVSPGTKIDVYLSHRLRRYNPQAIFSPRPARCWGLIPALVGVSKALSAGSRPCSSAQQLACLIVVNNRNSKRCSEIKLRPSSRWSLRRRGWAHLSRVPEFFFPHSPAG